MKKRFTDAPWVVHRWNNSIIIKSNARGDGWIATMLHSSNEGDAHLISAAPELFRCAELTLEMIEGLEPIFASDKTNKENMATISTTLKAVIAKAKGEQ